MRKSFSVVLACGLMLVFAAWAQVAAPAAVQETLAADLQEQIYRSPVTVKDMFGREETRQIPLTVFRPRGEGPFPLVVFNHGRAGDDKRALQGRQRFEHLSRYLVSKGFVVLVPTRVGYGETYGEFDPESSGPCNNRQFEPMSVAASEQVLAAYAWAKTLPYVDASRWLVMGESVGGLTTVATVWRNPPQLVGAVNFAGGSGGDAVNRPGNPCSPERIGRLWKAKAATAEVPMLWLYWANDKFWGESYPKQWHQAWLEGGGKADFHSLPAVGTDGHFGVSIDMNTWVPLMESYLAGLGFTQSGLITKPPATSHARVDEVDKVPVSQANQDNWYRKFLQARKPRAVAVSPGGSIGYATGDWAMGRALGYCQARRGELCKLYAVDDEVVWTP